MLFPLFIIITLPVFLLFSFFGLNNNKSSASWLLSTSALIAAITLFGWFLTGCPTTFLTLSWFISGLNTFSLSFIMDPAFVLFLAVALFVTWSIIEFSDYYMETDPNKIPFLNTLVLFLFFMLILVSSNNLFVLFIGWEGVGILSFILIGWWFTRTEANSAAMQAIIYNRIGDSGMLLFLLSSIVLYGTWSLNEIMILAPFSPLASWALFGIVVAAAGKSAQFILHPWLPSAMEGPTPVSALLHSSTMVVAGVFFLYRCSPILSLSSWAPNLISILGATTALFAASAALGQYDLKKVVAYSTTSQLGLMVVAIGLNIPNLALFHICTHAFFKSLLFLSSGSIIHSLNNEQDLRKMSNSFVFLPFTTSCIIIGSVALCGFPFLAGYYSKDLILEASQANIANSLSIVLSLLATLMTAIYSSRIIFYLGSLTNVAPLNPISEENNKLFNPLIRLVVGVFCSGWLISISLLTFPPMVLPFLNKIFPLILTIYAIIYVFEYLMPNPLNNAFVLLLSKFLSNNWFYVNITHGNTWALTAMNGVGGVLRTIDQGWAARLGAFGIISTSKILISFFQGAQSGNVTNYIAYSIMGFTILLLALL